METFKINDIEYECEFVLTNSDGKEAKLTKSAIRGMTIVDNFFEPFCDGSVTIANPYDYLEREFSFRGDGRDELKVKFSLKNPVGRDSIPYDMVFVLSNEGNMGHSDVRSENLKTFNIVAKDSIPFMDQIPHGKTFTGKSGKIIKDIFKELLGEDKVDSDWEDGEFEVDFSPPSTYRYADLIHYLMKYYYAKDGEVYVKSFINYDMKKGKYMMVKLSKIFEENSKNTIEAFGLGDLTSEMNTPNPNNPSPDTKVGVYVAPIMNFGYSTPHYEWHNSLVMNYLVVGYDKLLGLTKMKKLSLDSIVKKWEEKFVKVFSCISGEVKPFLVKNKKVKEKFRKIHTQFPLEKATKMVEADVISNFVFTNLQCSFDIVGSNERQSGKFVDLFSMRYDSKNKLKSDEKILGRWFVTELRHIFNGDIYINKFYATKTHAGPSSKYKEDVE